MIVSDPLIALIEQNLSVKVLSTTPVSGGSINAVYCLQTSGGKLLLKVNEREQFPDMFKSEAEGLHTIAATNTIAVPAIILQSEADDKSFLLLEWIETRRPTAKASALLGGQLAQMHRVSADSFGMDADNYMGSLHQSNKKHPKWSDFFIEERLLPMVKMAFEKQLLTSADVADFEQLYKKLPDLFDEEPPSLIHGDLLGRQLPHRRKRKTIPY